SAACGSCQSAVEFRSLNDHLQRNDWPVRAGWTGSRLGRSPRDTRRGGGCPMDDWIVLLHVVGAFLFVGAHGASIWTVNAIRRETSPARIGALTDLSGMSLSAAYVGLLLLLVGGIWAGIYAGFFGSGWIWTALALFVVIAVAMYAIATPFYKRLRI